MCMLLHTEIYDGLVYSFESEKLAIDENIEMLSLTTTDSQGNRPFVCLSKINDICIWAEISTQQRLNTDGEDLRLPLISDWRKNENRHQQGKWITDNQYINGCLYKGPCASFCLAGNDIRKHGSRRYVTTDAVKEIKKFFKNKKGILVQ